MIGLICIWHQNGNGIACIEEPLFEYRLHSNNEFGGRSLSQNLARWKKENGTNYNSFRKYRNEKVIKNAYLDGSLMCMNYRDKLNLEKLKEEENVIRYYNSILNKNIINISKIMEYKKYLSFNGIGKRKIKEIIMFHFPILAFLRYVM